MAAMRDEEVLDGPQGEAKQGDDVMMVRRSAAVDDDNNNNNNNKQKGRTFLKPEIRSLTSVFGDFEEEEPPVDEPEDPVFEQAVLSDGDLADQRLLFGIGVRGVKPTIDNDYMRRQTPFRAGMEVTNITDEECELLEPCDADAVTDEESGVPCFDGRDTREHTFNITNLSANRNMAVKMVVQGFNGFKMSWALPSLQYANANASLAEPFTLFYSVSGNYCVHIHIINGGSGEEIVYLHRLPGVINPVRPSTLALPEGIYFGSGESIEIV